MPQLILNQTQAYPPTQPPTQSDEEALFSVLFYLFALMCADNNVCSGIFRMLCAAAVYVGGMSLAYLPVSNLKKDWSLAHTSTLPMTKGIMGSLWLSSNIAGYYAYRATYNHEMRYINAGEDDIDRFDAVTDGLFSYAVASAFYSGMSALAYTGVRKGSLYMYEKCRDNCRGYSDADMRRVAFDDTSMLSGVGDEEEHAPRLQQRLLGAGR